MHDLVASEFVGLSSLAVAIAQFISRIDVQQGKSLLAKGARHLIFVL
ncbi:hypothetical protein [Acidovorax sp.]|nr:hypothetical protein [Acidovorax sp.]